jgi:hypothetical protein
MSAPYFADLSGRFLDALTELGDAARALRRLGVTPVTPDNVDSPVNRRYEQAAERVNKLSAEWKRERPGGDNGSAQGLAALHDRSKTVNDRMC